MNHLTKYKNIYIATLSIIIMLVFVVLAEQEKEKDRERIRTEKTNQYLQKIQTDLSGVPLIGKAFYVYDISANRELYAKNGDITMPIASLSKIPVAIFAKGEKTSQDIVITKEDLQEIGEYGLVQGEVFDKDDLLAFSLVVSSNDGMSAVSRSTNFLPNMNKYIADLGFRNTYFSNTTGLDIDSLTPGGVSTAKEISHISIRAWRLYPELFSKTIQKTITITSRDGKVHEVPNTNIILDKIPNIVFSKTGFTKLAGGTLSVIFKNQDGHYISVVVLGSTMEGRFSDMSSIVDVLYNTRDESIQYVLQN